MEINNLKRDTVERLRRVKKEQGFTITHIMQLLEDNGQYLSEATVKRVFSENADPQSFKYRDTLVPLADILLDFYSDASSTDDLKALKAMIRDKNMTICILIAKNEEIRADYDKRINHLQKQIDKLEEHLEFRERVVEQKDKVIEKLLNTIIDSKE